jgi:tRNA threonylcarbamoyladenosine biosynthesis protein TsaB
LLEGTTLVAAVHEVVGRGHAERLVPMIASLPGQGRAARILVDVGPGSFTGVRVGLAAALGLSIGWGVEVHGYSSLALLAASAFAAVPGNAQLAVILEGGHGEVFMQAFHSQPFGEDGPFRSLVPAAARDALGSLPAFGSGVRHLAALGVEGLALHETLPEAADARLLPAPFTTLPAKPIYGRAPDAKTLAERGLA